MFKVDEETPVQNSLDAENSSDTNPDKILTPIKDNYEFSANESPIMRTTQDMHSMKDRRHSNSNVRYQPYTRQVTIITDNTTGHSTWYLNNDELQSKRDLLTKRSQHPTYSYLEAINRENSNFASTSVPIVHDPTPMIASDSHDFNQWLNEECGYITRIQRSPTPIIASDNHDFNQGLNDEIGNNSRIQRSPTPILCDSNPTDKQWDPNGNEVDSSDNNNCPNDPFYMGTLQNIGNSCYMNAVIYALRFTPGFVHNLHHLVLNSDVIYQEDDSHAYLKETACINDNALEQFIQNFQRDKNCICDDLLDPTVIDSLHNIFRALTECEFKKIDIAIKPFKFRRAVIRINDSFEAGSQEDAHEFLMTVLNCIRDSGNSYIEFVHTNPQLLNEDLNPSVLKFDFFNECFIGKRITTTTCIGCETKTDYPEDIVDLFVPLPENAILNDDFIEESSTAAEKLTKVFCAYDSCKRHCEARRTYSYPQLPSILIVQLGRFDGDLKKLNTATPTPFKMKCFCTSCLANVTNHTYHLTSIIIHSGATLNSGHYISYVRHINQRKHIPCGSDLCCQLNVKPEEVNSGADPNEDVDDIWFICNDSVIHQLSQSDVEQKLKDQASFRTPYVLLYTRNDLFEQMD